MINYSEGDQVRYNLTGQFGFIKEVNEFNGTYLIEINGVEYVAADEELS